MTQLTKTDIEALPPGRHFDPVVTGFGVDVTAAGKRSFFCRYWLAGRRHFIKLGILGEITVEKARGQARRVRGAASLGKDPREELGLLKRADGPPTFSEWVKTYIEEMEGRVKRLNQIRYHLGRCPHSWRSRPVNQITEADVAAFFAKQRQTPILANRWRAHLSGCFVAARRRGYVTVNPCEGVQNYPEGAPRTRVLSADELIRLRAALDADRDAFAAAALRLQMETGCRIGETLAAKWEDFDLEAGMWRLPDTKSGRPQMVFLHPSTCAWLARVPRTASPYLVPGRDPEGHKHKLEDDWRRIRTAAGLPDDTRTHDVRRTVGLLIARTAGIHLASRVLRHSSVAMTARHYAPLDEKEIRGAVAGLLPAVSGEAK